MTSTIVITGATAGIGLAAAVQLATPDNDLVLVGRRPDGLAEAAAACAGAASVRTLLTDFASQESVRAGAAELLATCDHIDALALNAGGVNDTRRLTVDGIESTFATNHLGPFLYCELVKQRMVDSAPSRIVITSSVGHYSGTLDFSDLGYETGYSVLKAYQRSKLANVLYARHLAEELRGTGVDVVSFHPGAVATSIWSGAPRWARPLLSLGKVFMDSPDKGGARLVRLITGPILSGAYYSNDAITEPSALALNDSVGQRLVEVSRDMTGLSDPAATTS